MDNHPHRTRRVRGRIIVSNQVFHQRRFSTSRDRRTAPKRSETSRLQPGRANKEPRRNYSRNLRRKARNGHRSKRTEHQRPHKTSRNKIWNRESTVICSNHRDSRTGSESSRITGRTGITEGSAFQKSSLLGDPESHGIASLRRGDHNSRKTHHREI